MLRRSALGLLLLAPFVAGSRAPARAESTPQYPGVDPFVAAGIYHQNGPVACVDGQICWNETDALGRQIMTLGAGSPTIPGASPQSAFAAGGALTTQDFNNTSFTAWPGIIAAGGTYTPAAGVREIHAHCTAAGAVVVSDGASTPDTDTYSLAIGDTLLPVLPVSFTVASGTSCSFAGLK